jgi:hypothetical protein
MTQTIKAAADAGAASTQPARDLSELPGEVLGDGFPDWPADLLTFAERKAYQRGVAHARAVDASDTTAVNALENCRLYAARELYRNNNAGQTAPEWAENIIRFCAEGGAVSSRLRNTAVERPSSQATFPAEVHAELVAQARRLGFANITSALGALERRLGLASARMLGSEEITSAWNHPSNPPGTAWSDRVASVIAKFCAVNGIAVNAPGEAAEVHRPGPEHAVGDQVTPRMLTAEEMTRTWNHQRDQRGAAWGDRVAAVIGKFCEVNGLEAPLPADAPAQRTSPKYAVGDQVTYTNQDGLVFPGKTITAIDTATFVDGETHYFFQPTDTPWVSFRESELAPAEGEARRDSDAAGEQPAQRSSFERPRAG